MTIENISLLKALDTKMDYLNQRQRVIAQNVANADTPGYKPRDLEKPDFSNLMKMLSAEKGTATVRPVTVTARTTGSNQIKLTGQRTANDSSGDFKEIIQKDTYEVAPGGNAVIIEEQLINANRTMMDYNLMSNILQKQIGLLRTAVRSQ